jgi:Sulfotransferase family
MTRRVELRLIRRRCSGTPGDTFDVDTFAPPPAAGSRRRNWLVNSDFRRWAKAVATWIGVRPRMFALVSGCPRSGTSALESWLGAQPRVASFHESRILLAAHATLDQAERFSTLADNLDTVVDATRAFVYRWYGNERWLGGRLLLEKEPLEPIALPDSDYERFLRHIDVLFPERRLVFMVRDPVSTVWSMLNRPWGVSLMPPQAIEWSIEECVEIWIRNARLAMARVEDPATLVCRFEDLVKSPGEQSRLICEFLEINSWADFEPRPTKTASFTAGEVERILALTTEERTTLGYN